jgi:hypothetical protein
MIYPDTLGAMTSLSELDLSFNQIYQLPHGITGLTRVTALRLSFNELKASPLTLVPPAWVYGPDHDKHPPVLVIERTFPGRCTIW